MGLKSVVARRFVFHVPTLSCAPRIGLQADAVQRARRMRLESAASLTTLPSKVTKGLLQSLRGGSNLARVAQARRHAIDRNMNSPLHALQTRVIWLTLAVAAHQLHLQVVQWIKVRKAMLDGACQ